MPAAVTAPMGYIGRIPVRNIWLLLFYASDLFREIGRTTAGIEDTPDELPDLVAELLVRSVERRLRRNLTYDQLPAAGELPRVRGRIDVLQTASRQSLARGKVFCRYTNLTVNTIRNRYVRAALEIAVNIVGESELRRRCRMAAGAMRELGVSGDAPTRAQRSADRLTQKDFEDHLMVCAARLMFDLALPAELAGTQRLPQPEKEEQWVRRLFEKAVAGFYDVVLDPKDWRVLAGPYLYWPQANPTSGVGAILPLMKADIVVEDLRRARRIIIDTKFNAITSKGWYREETLRSGYLYQIYTYLRTQERSEDPLSLVAEGLLLHPAVGKSVDEAFTCQGHRMRFTTLDLTLSPKHFRADLLALLDA